MTLADQKGAFDVTDDSGASGSDDATGARDQKKPILLTVEDATVIHHLRQKAEAQNTDWRTDLLPPSTIQKTVDELYPGDQKCGATKAYRIQKLIPIAPEPLTDVDQKASAAGQEAQKAEAQPSLPVEVGTPGPLPERPRAHRATRKPESSAPQPQKPAAPSARKPPLPEEAPSGARPRTWPVLLLALPAFVAIWSGWVGLGELTGFGVVHPLPGIWDSATINTAITLPIGVETYAAYALHAWLSGRSAPRARTFAKWSAISSLLIGSAGQVTYHLLAKPAGPWQVTIVVACLPVAVLGMGAALAHLQHATDTPTKDIS